MFCEICGKEIEDNVDFCGYCGSMVEKEDIIEKEDKYTRIFIEKDEVYVASLGNSYLSSFLTTQKINRCVSILSDKRIYLKGNMLDINSGKIQRFNIQKTIDLEDITGTGFIYSSPQIWKLILAILTAPLIIPALLLIVSYIKNRETLFCVEYAGGNIKFDVSIYGLAESQDYEKQIRRAKNKLKEGL